MKSIFSTLIASALVILSSCGQNKGADLSDISNPTAGDSMMYYFGQVRAHEYLEDANTDTTLRSQEQREKYLEGIRKGMAAIRDDKDEDTYNRGVRVGTRMAYNILEFEKVYGIQLDEDVLLASIEKGLFNAGDIPELDYQKKFYTLLGELKLRAQAKDREKSQLSLIEEARERNLSKLYDNLYYRITRKGTGPYAHHGDAIYVAVSYQRANGEDIGMPSPEMVTLGAPGVPEVLNRAYSRLTKGSSAVFATTADAVFASRSEIMGMKPSEVMIMTITLNDIVSNLDEDPVANADSVSMPD